MEQETLELLYVFSVRILLIIAGMLLAVLGYRLLLKGVTGEASLTANVENKFSLRLLNASPGVFFLLTGGLTVLLCAYQISVEKTPGEDFGETGRYVYKGSNAAIDNNLATVLMNNAAHLPERQLQCDQLLVAHQLAERAVQQSPDRYFKETVTETRNLFQKLQCGK